MLDNDLSQPGFQVQDDKEPMNKTVWGKFLRGIGEYAALNLILRRGAKSLKAAKVPGASALSKATTIDPRRHKPKVSKVLLVVSLILKALFVRLHLVQLLTSHLLTVKVRLFLLKPKLFSHTFLIGSSHKNLTLLWSEEDEECD